MKQSKATIRKRQQAILDLLQSDAHRTVSAAEIAEETGVSLSTVRRDLLTLAKKQLILRTHRGAQALDAATYFENALRQRRQALAKRAASYVKNDDIVFVNSSRTAISAICYIDPHNFVTVITNNGNALTLERGPNISLILTGGSTKLPKAAMTGEYAINNLERTRASLTILGISGIDIDAGLTTENIEEVAINQLMLSQKYTNRRVIVADSAKIGHKASFLSGPISEMDVLITDAEIDQKIVRALRKKGILVDIVRDGIHLQKTDPIKKTKEI